MTVVTLPAGAGLGIGSGMVAGAGVAGYGAFREMGKLSSDVQVTVDGTLDVSPKLVKAINDLQHEGTAVMTEMVTAMGDVKLGKGFWSKLPGLRRFNELVNAVAKLAAASRKVANIDERPLTELMANVTRQSDRIQTEVLQDALQLRASVPPALEKIGKRAAIAGVLGALGSVFILNSLVSFE